MVPKAFVDINIVVDFITKRQPFDEAAAQLFNQAFHGKVEIFVSANIFPFLFYLLSKMLKSKHRAFETLAKFRRLVNILPLTSTEINMAFDSSFKDLEDAALYFVAENNGIPIFLTLNLADFKDVQLQVMTASDFLKTL